MAITKVVPPIYLMLTWAKVALSQPPQSAHCSLIRDLSLASTISACFACEPARKAHITCESAATADMRVLASKLEFSQLNTNNNTK